MSLEITIKANDAAGFAAAVRELAASLGVLDEPAPAQQSESAPAETPAPAQQSEPAPAEMPTPSASLEAVRATLAGLVQSGKQAEVKELLAAFGATKLSEIPAERYGELMEKAGAIG